MTRRTADASLVDRIILFIERVAAIVLGLTTVLVVLSALGRYGFATPVPDAFDVSRLVLGVAIAWGFASLGYRGAHIKVDLLAHGVSPKARQAMNFFAWAVLFAFTAAMTWKIWQRVGEAMRGGDATMELRLAHWPFFLAIWIGLFAALFTTAIRLWLIGGRAQDLGEYEGIDEQVIEDIRRK